MRSSRNSVAIRSSRSSATTRAISNRCVTIERSTIAMARSLVLTGFMATGKSAVARALARRLGWRQIDCDAEIVARAGKSIPEIFRTAGEAHFRVLEREVISALADDHCRCPQCGQRRPAVIATGGGAIV